MDNIKFEDLLGNPVSQFIDVIGDGFTNQLFQTNFYYIRDENINRDFYGKSYNCLSISINEKNNLQSITVHFRETINREFYDEFCRNYGEPNSVLIIENRQIVSEGVIDDDNFKSQVSKSTFDLREGTFEENPLYIIWQKENFQIKAFLRHKQNISEITFSSLKIE